MANSQKVDNSSKKFLEEKKYISLIREGLINICLDHHYNDSDIARVFHVNRSTITRYKTKRENLLTNRENIVALSVGSRSTKASAKKPGSSRGINSKIKNKKNVEI